MVGPDFQVWWPHMTTPCKVNPEAALEFYLYHTGCMLNTCVQLMLPQGVSLYCALFWDKPLCNQTRAAAYLYSIRLNWFWRVTQEILSYSQRCQGFEFCTVSRFVINLTKLIYHHLSSVDKEGWWWWLWGWLLGITVWCHRRSTSGQFRSVFALVDINSVDSTHMWYTQ